MSTKKETKKNLRSSLNISPFRFPLPLSGDIQYPIYRGLQPMSSFEERYKGLSILVPQSEFIRRYYTSGHEINDPISYPDDFVQVEVEMPKDESGKVPEKVKRWVRRKVARVSIPFEQVITLQQLIHLSGNPIEFTDAVDEPNEESKKLLSRFEKYWMKSGMEVAMYEAYKSGKITGNTAISFYYGEEGSKKTLCYKVYSALKGYTICDPITAVGTNKTIRQAIKYQQISQDGTEVAEYVDMWDEKFSYRFCRNNTGIKGALNDLAELFGLDGYECLAKEEHGFPFCPIAYFRDEEGACFWNVVPICKHYERRTSQMCQNVEKLPVAMMFLKGDNIHIEGGFDGRPIGITSNDPQADAKFVSPNDSSEASKMTLEILKDSIFLGGFIVLPPEPKSGDLPGIAIKLIYSPSIDKAMSDAKEWSTFIADVIRIFKYGTGRVLGIPSKMDAMSISGEIKPYIHQNTAEIINNLVQSKGVGILSTLTASSTNPYAEADEYRLIQNEIDKQKETEERTIVENLK